ncbi:cysteine synthase family protein [Candidatus Babeliales bacterium]|nr:cysteine synthase family protein [Candidatus Babeliales bacterium]MCF7899768.1 cysteine synthase family protein [Candidatus Babeliales bacterium]
MANKYKNLLELIGNTPLIKLEMGTKPTLLAKLEFLNPGGSLKDRSALFMVQQAEKDGLLKPGGTIVEASSGNQGIALAMIGAIKGYKVIITVPDRTSQEKISVLKAYGATVYVCPNTDSLDDPRGYHSVAERLHHEIPDAFMPNQYFNKSNPLAHYHTTGKEIWEQTNGEVTHVIIAAGSCGTISGVGKYLKEKNPNIKIIGVDAATSAFSSKEPKAYNAEGIGIDVVSETFDKTVVDEIIPLSDDHIFDTTKKLASQGILVGLSSGAVMHVSLEYCKKLKETDTVVTIFGDSGRAYLSKVFIKQEQEIFDSNLKIENSQKNAEKIF